LVVPQVAADAAGVTAATVRPVTSSDTTARSTPAVLRRGAGEDLPRRLPVRADLTVLRM